jgi:hypothetical protein
MQRLNGRCSRLVRISLRAVEPHRKANRSPRQRRGTPQDSEPVLVGRVFRGTLGYRTRRAVEDRERGRLRL